MKKFAEYVQSAKACLGPGTSDARLGAEIGYSQPSIADAKAGRASDELALALGQLLVKHGVIQHAGEVILVAHAERKRGPVQKTLMDYAGKVLRAVPSRVAGALAACAMALGVMLAPEPAEAAAAGGKGA